MTQQDVNIDVVSTNDYGKKDTAKISDFPDSSSNDINLEDGINDKYNETLEKLGLAPVVPSTRGVELIEKVKLAMDNSQRGKILKGIYATSILLCAWATSLDSLTTLSLQPLATSSFGTHSSLGTINIANGIISAVSNPFFAKFSDLISRTFVYIISIFFYTIGYIIAASAQTATAFIIGLGLAAAGKAGVAFVNALLVIDFTPLKWRGFVTSMLATPHIFNCWFAGLIVEDLQATNWKWGYGMFAIIIPVVLTPAITIMTYLDRKVTLSEKFSLGAGRDTKQTVKNIYTVVKQGLLEIDALGLLFLGFGFALFLLPFSLAGAASNGWKNPSLIAMLIVGGLLIITFFIYEVYYAPFPCMPKRILNVTLIMSVVIDFFYFFAGYIGLLFFSSYVFVVKDWSYRDWTYFNNTLTLALCIFGVIAGVLFRVTHRYKPWQLLGLGMRIIGYGIMIQGRGSTTATAALIAHPILIGGGGGLSVVASGVALQASVKHSQVALATAMLTLWTNIGGSIGDAVTTVIWNAKMPVALRKHLPASVNDTQIAEFFGSITVIHEYPLDSEIRQGTIAAYKEVNYIFFCMALGLSFVPFFCAFFQTNYHLNDDQNAVDQDLNKKPQLSNSPRTWKDKMANLFG